MKNLRKMGMIVAAFGLLVVSTQSFAAKPGKGAAKADRAAARASAHEAPGARLREILGKLDLTEDQKPKVDQVLADFEKKVQSLKEEAKATGDKETAREKARDAMSDARIKLLAILTPEQKAKFQELVKEQRAGHKTEKKSDATTQPTK